MTFEFSCKKFPFSFTQRLGSFWYEFSHQKYFGRKMSDFLRKCLKWYRRDFIAIISWFRYASTIFLYVWRCFWLNATMAFSPRNLSKLTFPQPIYLAVIWLPSTLFWESLFCFKFILILNPILKEFLKEITCNVYQAGVKKILMYTAQNSIPHVIIKQDGHDSQSDFYRILSLLSSLKR